MKISYGVYALLFIIISLYYSGCSNSPGVIPSDSINKEIIFSLPDFTEATISMIVKKWTQNQDNHWIAHIEKMIVDGKSSEQMSITKEYTGITYEEKGESIQFTIDKSINNFFWRKDLLIKIKGISQKPSSILIHFPLMHNGNSVVSHKNFLIDQQVPDEINTKDWWGDPPQLTLVYHKKNKNVRLESENKNIQIFLKGFRELSPSDQKECSVELFTDSDILVSVFPFQKEKMLIPIGNYENTAFTPQKIKIKTPINEITENIQTILKEKKLTQLNIKEHIKTINIMNQNNQVVQNAFVEIFFEPQYELQKKVSETKTFLKKYCLSPVKSMLQLNKQQNNSNFSVEPIEKLTIYTGMTDNNGQISFLFERKLNDQLFAHIAKKGYKRIEKQKISFEKDTFVDIYIDKIDQLNSTSIIDMNIRLQECDHYKDSDFLANSRLEIFYNNTNIASIPSLNKHYLFSDQLSYYIVHPSFGFKHVKRLKDGSFFMPCISMPDCFNSLILIDETDRDPEGKAFHTVLDSVVYMLQNKGWPDNNSCHEINVALCYDTYQNHVNSIADFQEETLKLQEPLTMISQLKQAFSFFNNEKQAQKIIYLISSDRAQLISHYFLSVIKDDLPKNNLISLNFILIGNMGNNVLNKIANLYNGRLKICKTQEDIIKQLYLLLFNKGDIT